jgi:hypothetical protein
MHFHLVIFFKKVIPSLNFIKGTNVALNSIPEISGLRVGLCNLCRDISYVSKCSNLKGLQARGLSKKNCIAKDLLNSFNLFACGT